MLLASVGRGSFQERPEDPQLFDQSCDFVLDGFRQCSKFRHEVTMKFDPPIHGNLYHKMYMLRKVYSRLERAYRSRPEPRAPISTRVGAWLPLRQASGGAALRDVAWCSLGSTRNSSVGRNQTTRRTWSVRHIAVHRCGRLAAAF